eukprot:scaffold421221_cov17-Prasinocladus_malaysianus.AAC.1
MMPRGIFRIAFGIFTVFVKNEYEYFKYSKFRTSQEIYEHTNYGSGKSTPGLACPQAGSGNAAL